MKRINRQLINISILLILGQQRVEGFDNFNINKHDGIVPFKKGPTVGSAPLDVNDNVAHTMEVLSSIVGSVGGSVSGLLVGLTGVSITDCALSYKDTDVSSITCQEFIESLSHCDSLAHLKPLLESTSKKYKKKPEASKPCFKN